MRIRTTIAAAACAVGIALSFPMQAHAAEGAFSYLTYQGPQVLGFPPNDQCIPLPGVADPSEPPAMYPFNGTDTSAFIFAGSDCSGQSLQILPGTRGQIGFGVRSVIFRD